MRILHLLASNGWGGAERVACTLHRLAEQHGHESAIDGPAFPELSGGVLEDTGVALPSSRFERSHFVWALGARRRRKRFAPDVVHVHLATPGLGSAAWLVAGSVPIVATFHLLRRARWPNDYFMPVSSSRVLEELARRQRRHAFVAVSDADRARLDAFIPGVAPTVVVNAPPLPSLRARAPVRLDASNGVLRLLSVGRLNEQKGFDRLVRALSAPKVRDLSWHWFVVGGGDERTNLERQVAACGLDGRVTFLGHLPSDGLFVQADLVLCPSRFEGMPLVPLEALLAGSPVLVSRIPSHAEQFGGAPASFLPENDAEWPDALSRVLSTAAAREALRVEQRALAVEDPRERFWQDYLRVYENVRRL